MLKLNPLVGDFFYFFMGMPKATSVFCNYLESTYEAAVRLEKFSAKISAVCRNESMAKALDSDMFHVQFNEHAELYEPTDKFHYGFCFPPFTVENIGADNQKISPEIIEDKMMFYEASKGEVDRKAPAHLLALEAMLNANIVSGYFAAILPRRWTGRKMKYLMWWNNNAASVARITLPDEAVFSCDKDGSNGVPVSGFELNVWQRPNLGEDNTNAPESRMHFNATRFAEFRYSPFIYRLPGLDQDSINDCWRSFRKHEWWLSSMSIYNKMIIENADSRWCGQRKYSAHQLAEPGEIWFFEPQDKNRPQVMKLSVDDMKKMPLAVQIKPGPPIRLTPHSLQAGAILLDIQQDSGTFPVEKYDSDGKYSITQVFHFDDKLSRESFSSVQEVLVKELCERGLVPCMTPGDAAKVRRQERWENINLTPMERWVPVKAVKGTAEVESVEWEQLYSDSGVTVTFPEILEQWRQRALKMKLNTITFDFQFENLIRLATRQSTELSDQMGLGKSRQSLLLPLLLGVEKVLLIVPKKLVGVWQEEIETTIMPYVRRQCLDWSGKVMHADYQVIEWGQDCAKENLKMFNIISYDKLKSLPRDGKFFKCPKCGCVAFSRHGDDKLACPGNVNQPEESRCDQARNVWKANNLKHKLRKHKVQISTGKKILWRNPNNVPAYDYEIVDPRPPRPRVQYMDPQKNIFKKTKLVVVGHEVHRVNGETVKVPIMKPKERPYHVAWTYADILRNTFNMIVIDEAVYAKNPEAKRTKALHHLCAKHRLALTGTPVRGYPQSILSVLNWLLKKQLFPNYRPYDPHGKGRFLKKYKTEVTSDDGKKKQIPKVNNPELFQTEIAPHLVRNIRNQPNVLACIPKKEIDFQVTKVDMDHDHRAYYQKWLNKFSEWWQLMKEETEGKAVGQGELIVKIGYLINASTIPHFMLDNIEKSKDAEFSAWAATIGKYRGPMTAKMLACQKLLMDEVVPANDKALIFSIRRWNLRVGDEWARKVAKKYSMVVDGTVSLDIKEETNRSKRQEMIDQFRHYDYNFCWAGLGALAEGMNIPEANWGIFLDFSWEPSDWKQALGRMLRPKQKKIVNGRFIIHNGAIDDYMAAFCLLKEKSMDEAVDYAEFSELSGSMVPDIHQYADAIVDGTESVMRRNMWLAVDKIRAMRAEQEGDELGLEREAEDDDE